MNLVIDLDKLETGSEWGQYVGELIRDEIRREIGLVVRATVKAHRKEIEDTVKRAADGAVKNMKEAKVREIAAKMLEAI
jgi:hypothetical protein